MPKVVKDNGGLLPNPDSPIEPVYICSLHACAVMHRHKIVHYSYGDVIGIGQKIL